MKHHSIMKPLFFFMGIMLACSLSSCRKYSCMSIFLTGIYVNTANTADTSVLLVRYPKGNNFTGAIDSVNFSTEGGYAFPESVNPFDYDWAIKMIPSGSTYQVKNFSESNNKYTNGFDLNGASDVVCEQNVYYTMNNVLEEQAGQPTEVSTVMPQGAYLEININ